jgi:murein DD-endopeptidase MepM/ murein hydrolase activator NlpD
MTSKTIWRLLIPLAAAALMVTFPIWTLAQETTPTAEQPAPTAGDIPQVHTVAEGENLTIIATTYGVSVEELMAANSLTDGDYIQVGQELVIPGGIGQTVSATYTVRLGDTLAGIAADFNTAPDVLAQQNRLVSLTAPLAPGQIIALDSRTGSAAPRPQTGRPYLVGDGETLLAVAARAGVSPESLVAANGLSPAGFLLAGQRLRVPDETVAYRDLPDGWVDVQIRPEAVAQGETVSIYVQNVMDGEPSGRLGEQTLHFTPFGRGHIALLGLDAFTEPGLYPLVIDGRGERAWQPLDLTVRIGPTQYDTQYIDVGEALDGLLDPALRAGEDAFLETIYARFNDAPRWQGVFQPPLENAFVSAGYGGRRSYNGGPIEIYHTGIDFAAPEGAPVLAPAAGTVVFSDTLELRGLTLIIDHGLGVMTGYYHLSEILVNVGDEVAAGQVVASVGSTGLSSGPHLHWDVRIMDVPVNGFQWTEQAFP